MLPYILMFIISVLLIWIGLNLKQKWARILLVLTGLLVPCIMAGARDISIGSDTRGYIHNLYLLSSKASNLRDFFQTAYLTYAEKDYCYLIFSYLIGKSGLGFGFLLFIYEALIVFPLFLSFKKMKYDENKIVLGLISFYFIFYQVTFNMLRQSIAIAFVVLAFSYYISNSNKFNKIISYLLIGVAFGFHSTSLIVIPFFLLYRLYYNNKIALKNKILLSIILVVGSSLFVIFYKNILTFIGESGIYPLALLYLERYSIKDFSFYQAFINLLLLLSIVINIRHFKDDKNYYLFLLTLSVINLVISSGLGYFIQYSQRIMLYIQYILLFCYVPKLLLKNRRDFIIIMICIGVLFFTWYLYFVFKNVHETVPYTLSF